LKASATLTADSVPIPPFSRKSIPPAISAMLAYSTMSVLERSASAVLLEAVSPFPMESFPNFSLTRDSSAQRSLKKSPGA